MTDGNKACEECGTKVPHNNKSGRLSQFDQRRAGRAGWFFQKDGKAWCPLHIPEWVAEWRAGNPRRD